MNGWKGRENGRIVLNRNSHVGGPVSMIINTLEDLTQPRLARACPTANIHSIIVMASSNGAVYYWPMNYCRLYYDHHHDHWERKNDASMLKMIIDLRKRGLEHIHFCLPIWPIGQCLYGSARSRVACSAHRSQNHNHHHHLGPLLG